MLWRRKFLSAVYLQKGKWQMQGYGVKVKEEEGAKRVTER